tara:strand:- start:417 stop:551 length:135 start_codon:yes stop_codon:yes gene_type:complete
MNYYDVFLKIKKDHYANVIIDNTTFSRKMMLIDKILSGKEKNNK